MAITSALEPAQFDRIRRAWPVGPSRASPKVLVVSSSFPYPVDIGRKVVIAGFLDYLAKTFGDGNVTFAHLGETPDAGLQSRMLCRSVPLPLDRAASRFGRALCHSFVRQRYALQEMVLYSKRAEERLRDLNRAIRPDLVIADTIRVARYFETTVFRGGRSILYLDDLYSLRYRRMIETAQTHPDMPLDAIGTFGRFLPAGIRQAARKKGAQRRLLAFESRLLEQREVELTERFDRILLLNKDETERLTRHSRRQNVATVKPLLQAHRGRLPRRFKGEPTFVFLGNLRYPANAYSLGLFITRVMPTLVKADRRAKLLVIGRQAGTGLAEHARRLGAHVEFLDYVEDITQTMATAAAMVIPLVYGSGLKMKALDALYYGIPIVSTDCGVDGIPVTPERDVLIANELDEFVSPLIRLLDHDLNHRISQAAQQLYAEEFAPAIVWREYGEIFASA